MSETAKPERPSTPIPVIANVSRVISKVVDRITGDRADYPLLVTAAVVEALKNFGIHAEMMYGRVAWIEILEDQTPIWAGCWGGNFHFWVNTQYGEIVDLNTSVAHRKRAHDRPDLKALYSPPMLWSDEIPIFYRYDPEGIAELELTEVDDIERFKRVLEEIQEKCQPVKLQEEEPFANEAIVCPGRKILDDSNESFKHFDRALSVRGLPATTPF